MKIVNGKLIDGKQQQIEEVYQSIQQVTQRQQTLESQLVVISRDDHKGNLQKWLQRVVNLENDHKANLQKCLQRVVNLEKVLSQQSKELRLLKIALVSCCIGLGVVGIVKNQPIAQPYQYEYSLPK
jgi:DNA repair ATPase RecN